MQHRIVAASTSLQRPVSFEIDIAGLTLAEMAEQAIAHDILPSAFRDCGRIELEGYEIPRANWHLVRAKPDVHIFMAISPAGGGGGGDSKNVIATVAAVLLVVVATAITAGALGPAGLGLLGANFAGGALGAQVLGGVVGLVGQLAINALFKPPLENEREESDPQAQDARIAGNLLSKGQTLPRVAGTHRIAPPFLAQPRSWLSGDDVYVEGVFALAGPHDFSDIQINGTSATDLNGIEIWIDDGTVELRGNSFDRTAITDQLATQLTKHKIRSGESGYDDRELVDQDEPLNSLPEWHRVTSRAGTDYLELRFVFANMVDPDDSFSTRQNIWLRLRGRKVGESDWKNIATITYGGKGQGSYNRNIVMHFSEYPGGMTGADRADNGFRLPETLNVVTNDHYIYKSSDPDHFPAAYSHDWVLSREGIEGWLNDSYYLDADAQYEFEVKRSEMVLETDLMDAAQMRASSGNYLDYFDARYSGGKWKSQENIAEQGDAVMLQSAVSVFMAPPIPTNAPIATLQIRAKNQDFSRVSVLASGLVPDWNGSAWTGSTITSNPAAHYRYVLTGAMTVDPIDAPYVDDTTLVAWRTECVARGYACDAVLAGTIDEALDLIASCGFARPDIGLKYGVVYHRDTNHEPATQMFSARNVRNLSWRMAYSLRPAAFNCEYFNAARNYELDEVLIDDPYAIEGGATEIEAVRFPGLTTEAQVRQRAEFDFGQARRAVRYSFEIGIEYLATSRGEIAILSHDALHRHAAWGRIHTVVDGTGFTVDSDFTYTAGDGIFDLANVFAEDDIFSAGAVPGVLVRTAANNVLVYPVASFDADSRRVTISDTSQLTENDLVVFGPLEQAQKRVQVVSIEPLDLETARVTVQDEAVSENVYVQPAAASIVWTGQAPTVDISAVVYSFELTAGTAGGFVDGYSSGSFGSLDAEPLPGETLFVLTDTLGFSGQCAFIGDVTAKLSGLTIWVEGVEYPFTTDWHMDGGNTVGEWSSGPPNFSNGVTYSVEIK